jgi:DNA-binding response OmpR family regulator
VKTGLRVLVVEDEEPLRLALVDALTAEGFDVLEAGDGETGLQLALREAPDLVLLDVMLPGRDGLSVLAALRKDRLTAPVLILSARGEEYDRVRGFEVGADDYVVKPFSVRELLLRVKAVLSRADGDTPGLEQQAGRLRIGDSVVDFTAYALERGGERTGLSQRELDLLRYFVDHDGEVLDRTRLLRDVWGAGAAPGTRTVDMHVLKLRRKLEPDPDEPQHIVTVHGVGYRFDRRGDSAS